jgi:hypothetical protein
MDPSAGAPNLDWSRFLWEMAKGCALAIAAVYSFWANQQSEKNSQALASLKLAADSRAQQFELDIKVYELVEKTLSLDGPAARGHGVAAAALINALTNPPLRSQLLNALRVGSKDPGLIKELDDTLEFDASEGAPGGPPAAEPGRTSQLDRGPAHWIDAVIPPLLAQSLPGALKGYRIDIFYCEGSSPATTAARKNRAQAASDRLKPAGTDVTVRVRNLPTLVQARPGYKSVADEIRYNDDPKEVDAAKLLAAKIGISAEHVRKIDYKTPAYLSVFYCAN